MYPNTSVFKQEVHESASMQWFNEVDRKSCDAAALATRAMSISKRILFLGEKIGEKSPWNSFLSMLAHFGIGKRTSQF